MPTQEEGRPFSRGGEVLGGAHGEIWAMSRLRGQAFAWCCNDS